MSISRLSLHVTVMVICLVNTMDGQKNHLRNRCYVTYGSLSMQHKRTKWCTPLPISM